MRQNLFPQPVSHGGQADPVYPSISGYAVPRDPATLFHSVQQEGDVGAVHHQQVTEFALAHAIGLLAEEVQGVELGFREAEGTEESATLPPEGARGAQHLDDTIVAGG